MAPPPIRGYADLVSEYENVKAVYDQTGHAQRVCDLLETYLPTSTVNKIVVMGIGQTAKGWRQLSMIMTVAEHLGVPTIHIFAQEDHSVDEVAGGERAEADMDKYAALYRDHLGVKFNEHEPDEPDVLRDVGPIVQRITARTLVFAPLLPLVTTGAVLMGGKAWPEVYIGHTMDSIREACTDREDDVYEFAERFEDLHDWIRLPRVDESEDDDWNVRQGEFHRMALYWKDE